LSVLYGEAAHLWLDSPTVGTAADAWVSPTPDRGDGYFPAAGAAGDPYGVTALERPVLTPGEVDAYVVTAGADRPDVDYRHCRRWTWHPADDGTTP
jgi:hypothetical protein